MISRIAIAASLAMALAACGSSNQPTSQSTETITSPTPPVTAPAPTEAVPSAAPSAEAATPSPTPTPTPTPSATSTGKASKSAMQSASSAASDAATVPTAFNQCAACHSTTPGKTIIGPSLAGVYGTKAGQVPGFQFSDAMKNSGLVLNASNLDKFLADPKGTVPGTIMALNGIKDASQRKAIIDYLKTLK